MIRSRHANDTLFLNVNSIYQAPWQWHSANQLVFDSGITDDGHLQPVRSFLSRLKPWLLLCGAKEVKGADSINIELSNPSDMFAQQRAVYRRLRNAGSLTDVAFVGCSGGEILAHRIVLATFSTILEGQFTGGFAESTTNANGIVRIKTEYSIECLQYCIGKSYLRLYFYGLRSI
jgi:hypothetical protein